MSTKAPILGIDLGTTNSVVAVADGQEVRVLADREGNHLVPSVVSFLPNGQKLVGYPARNRRLIDAQNTVYSTKRLIGRPFQSDEVARARGRFAFELREGPTGGVVVAVRGKTYTFPEISAFILRHIHDSAEETLGVKCKKAVITVPANFNELQRSATKAAGRVAGLEVIRILNEPTAAALAYGFGRGSNERIAIYDFGGGTFDVTVLELSGDVFEVVATAGDSFLGGDDIDQVVSDVMARSFLENTRYDIKADPQAHERLRAAAEWAKCELSSADTAAVLVPEIMHGPGGAPVELKYDWTRADFEKITKAVVQRSFDVCEEAMKLAGLRPTTIDSVILVGGATRIPLVRRMVKEYFGKEPLTRLDPDLVVAQGAAIQAYALSGAQEKGFQLGAVKLKKMTQAEVDAARAKAGQD